MAKLQGGTTVFGLLSASGVIYASGGTSADWNTTTTSYRSASSTFFTSSTTSTYLSTTNVRLSGATITGTLSASGLLSQAKNHCTVSLTAAQLIPTNANTTINFNAKDDPNNWFNLTNRSFKPNVNGFYNLFLMVSFVSASGTAQINAQIQKNGATIALSQSQTPNNISQTHFAQAITFMNGTTDEIIGTAYSSPGQNINGTVDGAWTKLEAFKIS